MQYWLAIIQPLEYFWMHSPAWPSAPTILLRDFNRSKTGSANFGLNISLPRSNTAMELVLPQICP